MDNSAALRVIFRKKKKKKVYFSVWTPCSPCTLILLLSFVYVDVRKRANVLDGACSFTASSVNVIRAVLHQAYGSAFLFFFVFFFFPPDNFDFKILINYSKASVIVLPHKQAPK